jgi:hypothetical protein
MPLKMPDIDSGSRATATWVCNVLLEQGFSVRGTVCSEEKGEFLRKLFAIYGAKFEYAVVERTKKVFDPVALHILAISDACLDLGRRF